MKRILPLTFISLLITVLSFAQVPAGMGKSDPKAKVVLDAVSKKFKAYKNVQANFNLRIENGSGKLMGNKAGKVMMKGTRYRISLPGQEIYSDGENVWTYDEEANEVTISKLDSEGTSITPQKLFTNFYDRDFLYKLNGNTKVGNRTMQEIELTPVDKSRPFFKVLLHIDNSLIYSTRVFEKTGNRYTYSVSNLNTTSVIPDANFVFDAKNYPGVEVVDLR
jgi:outer membrane lipoprotein-sorting protein